MVRLPACLHPVLSGTSPAPAHAAAVYYSFNLQTRPELILVDRKSAAREGSNSLNNGCCYRQVRILAEKSQRANPLKAQNPLKCRRCPHLSGAHDVGRLFSFENRNWYAIHRWAASLSRFSLIAVTRLSGQLDQELSPIHIIFRSALAQSFVLSGGPVARIHQA